MNQEHDPGAAQDAFRSWVIVAAIGIFAAPIVLVMVLYFILKHFTR